MNRVNLLLIAFILFFGIPDISALTFEETSLALLKGSGQFKLEEYSLETFSETLKTENNLPDPQIDGEYLFAPGDETNRWGAELSWGIDWPGVYRAKRKESDQRMDVARQKVQSERQERLYDIQALLSDYILCHKKLKLIEVLNRSNDSICRFAEFAVKNGEITKLDLNKAKLEHANIKATKATLLHEEKNIILSLTEIFGDDCSSILSKMNCEFPAIDLPDESELISLINASPALMASRAEIESGRLAGKVARMETFPSLTIGYKHAFEDGIHFNGGTLGISIPVFSGRNKQKASKAMVKEAEFQSETLLQTIMAGAKELIANINLMQSQIREIEPILKETDHSAVLLKAYENGLISMIDYLTERNYFTNATLELLNLQHSRVKAYLELRKYINSIN